MVHWFFLNEYLLNILLNFLILVILGERGLDGEMGDQGYNGLEVKSF